MVNYNAVIDIWYHDNDIVEPVDLVEAKEFCKIDISTDDNLITALIIAARQQCEAYTCVGFVEHYITAVVNNSNGGIYIPYGPLGEIFEVVDKEGNEMILNTDYKLQGNEFVRIMEPKVDEITIDYSTGYGYDIPSVLKTALLNQIYYLYDNRSQGVDDISPVAKLLLNPFRRV
jgi:uncharacterized phiE125 gp8 family phage protein